MPESLEQAIQQGSFEALYQIFTARNIGPHAIAYYKPEVLIPLLESVVQKKKDVNSIAIALSFADAEGWTGFQRMISAVPESSSQILSILKMSMVGPFCLANALAYTNKKKGETGLHTVVSCAKAFLPEFLKIAAQYLGDATHFSGPDQVAKASAHMDQRKTCSGLHAVANLVPDSLPVLLDVLKKAKNGPDKTLEALTVTNCHGTSGIHAMGMLAPKYLPSFLSFAETALGSREKIRGALLSFDRRGDTGFDIIARFARPWFSKALSCLNFDNMLWLMQDVHCMRKLDTEQKAQFYEDAFFKGLKDTSTFKEENANTFLLRLKIDHVNIVAFRKKIMPRLAQLINENNAQEFEDFINQKPIIEIVFTHQPETFFRKSKVMGFDEATDLQALCASVQNKSCFTYSQLLDLLAVGVACHGRQAAQKALAANLRDKQKEEALEVLQASTREPLSDERVFARPASCQPFSFGQRSSYVLYAPVPQDPLSDELQGVLAVLQAKISS